MLFQTWIDKRIEAYQSELVRKYCDEVEAMYAKMRGWRHDYHNHIQALQASMALGNYEEVNRYLSELNNDLTGVDTTVKTGRVMVDAVLNGKMNIAAQHGIPVNVKARIPEETGVSDVDLCVILGNLLDNAIEENRTLPPQDRFIRIYLGRKNTQLYLALTNAAGKKREKRGGVFASSRGADHGFGLSRVAGTVRKYGGLFSADSEDGGFMVEILIPLTGPAAYRTVGKMYWQLLLCAFRSPKTAFGSRNAHFSCVCAIVRIWAGRGPQAGARQRRALIHGGTRGKGEAREREESDVRKREK